MKDCVWQQFSLQLPEDWEMLRYSRTPEQGNCIFADRYSCRFEMNWKQFSDWPDFDRMLDDYQKRLKEKHEMDKFESVAHGPWHGFHCKGPDGWNSRFGRFFEPNSKLLELVFVWPDRVEKKFTRRILNGVRLELPQNGLQRWCAFGMDLRAGDGLRLDECIVRPAMAKLVFNDKDRPSHQETFERYGMVDEWLHRPVEEWLSWQNPKPFTDERATSRHRRGHTIHIVRGRTSAMSFPKIRRRKNVYEAAAWICPNDGRLYRYTHTVPAKDRGDDVVDLAGARLSCCSALKAG